MGPRSIAFRRGFTGNGSFQNLKDGVARGVHQHYSIGSGNEAYARDSDSTAWVRG
jgi:hypothetical protein